ncbi:MAG: SDR family NAD(P)-dependent oxidoreductase [Steroidobacteraceae bacterium]
MSNLAGKVAVVTGASKGIGASIARGLAAAGATVVVNYAASRNEAEGVVADITRHGGKAAAIQGDVSKGEEVQRLFEQAERLFGRADILVNNAGVYEFAPLEAVSEQQFHRQFDINVLGTLLATREAVSHFKDGGGSVINISSVVSQNPLPNSSIYSATKSAVDAITRALAKELGGRNIRVNAIAPGPVETEGLQKVGIIGTDVEKQFVAGTPLGRIGQPVDIAQVAVFLASDESAWVTGERISASGGLR